MDIAGRRGIQARATGGAWERVSLLFLCQDSFVKLCQWLKLLLVDKLKLMVGIKGKGQNTSV